MIEENFMMKLIPLEKKESSYLEKIGVSQKETVMANILKYYFDPNENHGLNDLFIKSLLQTKAFDLHEKKQHDSFIERVSSFKDIIFNNESTTVKVEVKTFNNNRIDIVINTKKLVIAIEFKINHELNNPLDDYVDFIKSQVQIGGKYYSKDAKNIYFVVLTPYWKAPSGIASNNQDFVQIILAGFIGNIKNKIDNHWENDGTKNTHQYFAYHDFITTIENRGRIVSLIKKYSEMKYKKKDVIQIDKLHKENKLTPKVNDGLNEIKTYFKDKIKELNKRKNDYKSLKASNDKIESAIYRKVYENIEYKIRLSLLGWYFEGWEWDNGKGKIIIDKKIGTYFSSIEDLVKEIETLESFSNDIMISKGYEIVANEIGQNTVKEFSPINISSEEIDKAVQQGFQSALKLLDLTDGIDVFKSKWSWFIRQSVLKLINDEK